MSCGRTAPSRWGGRRRARALEQCREDGVLQPGVDTRQTAIDTVAPTEGAQLLWLSDLDDVDVLASVRHCLAAVLTVPS